MPRGFWLLAWMGAAVSFFAGCGGASFHGFGGFSSGSPTAARWIEVVTPHFVIDTDVPEPRALAIARALEDSRAALLESAWSGATGPRGRTRVVLFARQRDLSRYAGRNNQGVVFSRQGFERLLAFTPGSRGDSGLVGVHELVHDLSRWFLPVQPPWLSEGLAMYLESIEVDRAQGRALMGAVPEDAVASLRSLRFGPKTARLFAAGEAKTVDPRDATSFYLGSWALVHYLRSEEPEGLAHFQKALSSLTPWRLAWAESFPGLTHAALDRKLRAYLSGERFMTWRSHFTPPMFTPALRDLSQAEVHGVRALLADTSGESLGSAEVAAALALDPAELSALTVRFHTLAASSREERTEIARRAVDAHPDDARAWLLATLAANEVGERRRALAQAERLDPDHPGVAWLLAEDALARNDPGAALMHVWHAQRRAGVTPRNLALQFAALAAANRCDDAAAVLKRGRLLLSADCRACTDYLRRAYSAPTSCSFEAL